MKDKILHTAQNVGSVVEGPIEQIGAKTLIFGSTTGYISGVALAKSGLANLSVARDQVHGKDHTLLKVWLSSVGTGFLCYGTASLAGLMNVTAAPTNLWMNLIGGWISGASAYFAGTTPELLCVQLAKFDPRSWYTYLGGLLGTATYGLLYTKTLLNVPWVTTVSPSATTLHEYFKVPFYTLAIPLTVAVAGACYFLESLHPISAKKAALDPPPARTEPSAMELIYQKQWNPYFCGALVGLAQIPAYYVTKTLFDVGSSSSIMSKLFDMLQYRNTYFESVKYQSFKIIFDIGLVLGSYHALKHLKKIVTPTTTVNLEKPAKPKKEFNTTMKLFYILSGFGLFFGASLSKGSPLGVSRLAIGSIVTSLAFAKAAWLSSYLSFLL